MNLTSEQIAKIRQKDAMMADALKRDSSTNYREGWFFVTLNTRNEVPVLSTCVGNPDVADSEQDAPRCEYTEVGTKVVEVWKSIPDFHSGVIIDAFEAMPEHVHGLIYLRQGNKEHLGQIIKGFMIGCSHAYWDTLGIEWRKDYPTKGVPKGIVFNHSAQKGVERQSLPSNQSRTEITRNLSEGQHSLSTAIMT